MKKLVLVLAVAFGASMVACSSSNSEANAEGQDTTTVVEETVEEVAVVTDSNTNVAPTDSNTNVAPTDSDKVANNAE